MASDIARDLAVDRDELLAFVRPRHHGILTTTRADGSPQLSPVSMGVDPEDRIVVSSYPERVKSKNLRLRPAASMLVLSDGWNGDWVQVDGSAEVLDLPEALEPMVDYYRSISGEHPDWDEYRAAMLKQGKVLLRLTIETWGPISKGGYPARLAADG